MKRALAIIAMAASLGAAAAAGEPAKNATPAPPTATTSAEFAKAARERITTLVKQMNQAVVRVPKPARVKETVTPENRMQYDSVVLRDIQVEVNGTAATERHIAEVKGSFANQPFAGTVRSTSTWQYRNGDWQMVTVSAQPAK